MQIVIMHQTITNHDAIGNDIECMYKILSKSYPCFCYAQNCFNTQVEYISADTLERLLSNKENLIIYHHSVYWKEGEELLIQCKAQIIFRYHNITPPDFFKEYNEFHYLQCKKGRAQTLQLQNKFPEAFWLSDSLYNTQDITQVNPKNIGICPPFNKLESWSEVAPDEKILEKLLLSQSVNLLFVGRIAPNKGHFSLIDTLYQYCTNFGNNIKLRIIGKFDEGLPGYNQKIFSKIEQYGLQQSIEFIGEVTDSTLMSYYLGSDLFICMSEHEGFCVPIVEAQYFGLPVIAADSSAISETIGKYQLCLPGNPCLTAAAIRIISQNRKYRDFLRACGKKNFKSRFSFNKISSQFKKILKEEVNIEI